MSRLFSKIQQFPVRSIAAALPWPRTVAGRISVSPSGRRIMAMTLAAIGMAAILTYIAAVNFILLKGEALRRGQAALRTLEREQASLQGLATERSSPAWLSARSRENGMVAVGAVRYLDSKQAVAMSSPAP